jgi:hypothetical protein
MVVDHHNPTMECSLHLNKILAVDRHNSMVVDLQCRQNPFPVKGIRLTLLRRQLHQPWLDQPAAVHLLLRKDRQPHRKEHIHQDLRLQEREECRLLQDLHLPHEVLCHRDLLEEICHRLHHRQLVERKI